VVTIPQLTASKMTPAVRMRPIMMVYNRSESKRRDKTCLHKWKQMYKKQVTNHNFTQQSCTWKN